MTNNLLIMFSSNFLFLPFVGQTNQLSHQTEAKTTERSDVHVGGNDSNAPSTENSDKSSETTVNDDKNCDISVECNDKKRIENGIETEQHESKQLSADLHERTPFGAITHNTLPNGKLTSKIDAPKSKLVAPKSITKKAVSLDKIDETAKKFISGEIIVDQENPFKKLNAKRRSDFFASTPTNLQHAKVTFAEKELPNDEYITTEDVLKESKYVKTYIKNPDDYFVYDPTIKARLLKEEAQERAVKIRERNSPPKKANGTRISKTTQERLRELKNRYSPSPLNYSQQKIRTYLTNGYANGVNSKLPTVRKGDRSKYPDLSQIKVKTGTDLEGSFFNPKEVAINAKKFDARIKNTQFGSQDDLDDIADLTSDFDANGLDELDQPVEEKPKEVKIELKDESLTNTINSKEFQKFLAEKGLILQPPLRIIEKTVKMATQNETDAKKARKPSVLQRLFPNGFFSSRRRTTPKDSTPMPIKIQTNDAQKKEGRLTSARRLVLHRQSMPANFEKANLQVNSHGGSSSSISSTLTNVENNEYLESYRANSKGLKSKSNDSESTRSLSGLRYIDSSSNSTIVTCDRNKVNQQPDKPTPRPRQLINGKPSAPMVPTPLTSKPKEPLKNKTSENRDSAVKARVRPKIPISNLRPLVNHAKADQVEIQRPNGPTIDAMKNDPKRRLASKLPERLTKMPTATARNLCQTSFDQPNRNDAKTPDTFADAKQPKTSTPIIENAQAKFQVNKPLEQSLNLSPIPNNSTLGQAAPVQLDAATWAKVLEMKQNADRQLYSQPLIIQAHMNAQPMAYSPRIVEQPIYDRLPGNNNMVAVQSLYAKVEKKSAPINAQFVRSAPYRQSLDQIKAAQPLNAPIVYHQPVFVRNSPQRNTISGVYRGQAMQRIAPPLMVQAQQPPRPQSVLDEMITGRHGQASPSNVQLRRKPLSRGEIMNQVIEFCRKSMNKTPTKFFRGASNEQIATVHRDATSSEVSPISCASATPSKASPSIASSRSGRIAPQVPIRNHSLPQQTVDQHPIYERIPRHNMQTPVVNGEPVNGMIGHYAVPPKRYVVVDSERLTPAQVKQYQHMNGSHASLNQPVYVQSAKNYPIHEPYEYVNIPRNSNPSLGNNLLQIYHPSASPKPANQVGRFTPIMLPTIPQHQQINGHAGEVPHPHGYAKTKVAPKHGRIVMLNNVEQMYRPITMQPKNIRYRSSQTSLDSRHSVDTLDSVQSQKRVILPPSK